MIVNVKRRRGVRANIPSWLADPDGVAPCICGRPMIAGEPNIMAEGELGMKRWFHISCWNMFIDNDDVEWDDWEDDE